MNFQSIPSADTSPGGVPLPGRARLWAVLLPVAAVCLFGLWAGWQYLHPGLRHYRQGMDYAAAGQADQAEREWQQGVQEEPTFPGCFEKLGDLYAAGHNYPAAAIKYAAAAKLAPNDGALFLRLARMQQMTDGTAAVVSARRAAALAPNDAFALSLYGELARKAGNLSEAVTAMRRAHRLRPSDPDLLHAMVQLELDTLDVTDAEVELAPWLKAHPDDADGCYLMAVVTRRMPRTPESVRAGLDWAQRGAAGRPNDLQAGIVLGQFYLDAGRPQDALRTYLAFAETQPADKAVLDGLVECYNRLGRRDQAEKTAARLKGVIARQERIDKLKRALNADPSAVEAGLELSRLEEAAGDKAAAQADYLRILRLVPEDPRTHAALAAFYRRTGRPDLALQAEQPGLVGDER